MNPYALILLVGIASASTTTMILFAWKRYEERRK